MCGDELPERGRRSASSVEIALAIPRDYRKRAVVGAVRRGLSPVFGPLALSESDDDGVAPALTVLIDGWGRLGLLAAVRRCREMSLPSLAIATARRRSLAALLEAGACDAVRWPIPTAELVARVRAHVQRASSRTMAPEIRLDAVAHALVCLEVTVPLTPAQWAVLNVLLLKPGQWVASRELMSLALHSRQADTARVRAQIHRIRAELQSEAWRLQSNRALGYRFDVSV